jgi:hypothetical protein
MAAIASPTRPSTGGMNIFADSQSPDGGNFQSLLRVYPEFTFTRLSDHATRVLDVGALPDEQRPDDPLQGIGVWRDGCVPPALATTFNPHFCPGQTPAGKKTLTVEQSQFAKHGVYPAQPRLEHFACYRVQKIAKDSVPVRLTDQFGSRDTKVLPFQEGELCNPARKNKEPQIRNRHDHLRCYPTPKANAVDRLVRLRNQFGMFGGSVREPTGLCVPSTKKAIPKSGKVPKAPKQKFDVDHFQCYKLKPGGKYKVRKVRIADQFGVRHVKVRRPARLCAPVDKNQEGIRHPVRHLVCYEPLKRPKVKRLLSVHNQFGAEKLTTRVLSAVCVPTLKVIGEK